MVETRHRPTLSERRVRHDEIIRVAEAHGAAHMRVFGSVARGDADAASDIDFLVDIVADAHGLAYFGVLEELRRAPTNLLGWDIDVVCSAATSASRRGPSASRPMAWPRS